MRKSLLSLVLVAAALAACSSNPSNSAWIMNGDGSPWVDPDGQCVQLRPLTEQDKKGFCYEVMTQSYQQRHHYEPLDESEFGFMYPKVEPTPDEAAIGPN